MSQFICHRLKSHWEKPEDFYPDHFSPQAESKRHKYAYFPFGSGSRHCIGQGFALLELQIAIAAIIKNFRWTIENESAICPIPGFVLRPNGPIYASLSPAEG